MKWTFEANPVIRPGELNPPFDAQSVGAPCVLQTGDAYRLFYAATGAHGDVICTAEAPVDEPNAWRGLGCVIGPGDVAAVRERGARWPWACACEDGRILLYYCAHESTSGARFADAPRLAVGADGGRTWQRAADRPLFTQTQAYEREGFGGFCVLRIGEEYHMFYSAVSAYTRPPKGASDGAPEPVPVMGIGLAVSPDGMEWNKPDARFVIMPRFSFTQPYESMLARPCVILDGSVWRMWVTCHGAASRVCALTSRDALRWHWQECGTEGEFGLSTAGAFDGRERAHPAVVRHGEGYRCWFTGGGAAGTGIGFATAG